MAKGLRRAASTSSRRGKKSEYLYGEGPARAAQIRISRTASRVRKHAARLKSYGLPDPSVVTHLDRAADELYMAEKKLAEVPADWRPARGTLGATPIEEGSKVFIKDAVANKYKDMFDTKKAITVTQILGARVVCACVLRGSKNVIHVPIPRLHVQMA